MAHTTHILGADTIADRTVVRPCFFRSVHLEEDSSRDDSASTYVITPQARRTLGRVADVIEHSVGSAWTLTGPYGSGKSSFALFLTQLLCPTTTRARTALRDLQVIDPELATRFNLVDSLDPLTPSGYVRVVVTGARESATACLLRGLRDAVARSQPSGNPAKFLKKVSSALARVQAGEVLHSRMVVDLFRHAMQQAKETGYRGILLIVDELGKVLEFAANDPAQGDVFVLQELAELAARPSEVPLIFIGILHQTFEQYGLYLDQVTRQEWAKVQGRFEDIAFQEPPEQMIRLVADALEPQALPVSDVLKQQIEAEVSAAIEAGVGLPGMSAEEFCHIARRCYPLHPVALVVLPYLFRRYGQNERSLFSYLASREPHGLQGFLEAETEGTPAFRMIRVPDLFDYFVTNFGAALYAQPGSRAWVEAIDALDRLPDPTETEVRLIKTIGLLGGLGEINHLLATPQLLRSALDITEASAEAFGTAIAKLERTSTVVYRRFNKTYRLWQGSDLDLDSRLEEGRSKVSDQLSVAAVLQKHSRPRPLVARRHSYRTGALRFFDLQYADSTSRASITALPLGDADGRVLLYLADSAEAVREAKAWARSPQVAHNGRLIVAIPNRTPRLARLVQELESVHWVSANTPELRDDQVARRELAERLSIIERALVQEIDRLFDPEPDRSIQGCEWYFEGRIAAVGARAEVSSLLSDVCDALYPDTPQLRNELINRRRLSSASAAARNELLKCMVEQPGEALVGIEGFPPSRSMYESVLRAPGIHRANEGQWGFGPPFGSSHRGFQAAWQAMERFLEESDGRRRPVTELYDLLKSPPLGLLDGPLPVLLTALLMHHLADVALYERGSFLPAIDGSVVERLVRDGGAFEIQYCRLEGLRLTVLTQFAHAVAGAASKPGEGAGSAQVVDIVRQLCLFASRLPVYTRRTLRISDSSRRVRDVLLRACDPYSLLFRELPEACGVLSFGDREADVERAEVFFSRLRQALSDLQRAYGELLLFIERLLAAAFNSGMGPEGRSHLAQRAAPIIDYCVEPRLKTFLLRTADTQLPHGGWLESVGTLLAQKPPKDWSDADAAKFEAALAEIRQRFLHLEPVALEATKQPLAADGSEVIRLGVLSAGEPERERVMRITSDQRARVDSLQEQVSTILSDESANEEIALAVLAMVARRLMGETT